MSTRGGDRAHRAALAAFACAALLPLTSSCGDPVHDGAVQALGGESPGIPAGEFHRAGQPCTVCHSKTGPANTEFMVAGTVFAGADNVVGVSGAQVLLIDSLGVPFNAFTNCVGNFWVTADQWNPPLGPAFPIKVGVAAVNGKGGAQMIGHVGREGSCANCHKDPSGLDSPGHVFPGPGVPPNPDPNCPVNPNAAGGP